MVGLPFGSSSLGRGQQRVDRGPGAGVRLLDDHHMARNGRVVLVGLHPECDLAAVDPVTEGRVVLGGLPVRPAGRSGDTVRGEVAPADRGPHP